MGASDKPPCGVWMPRAKAHCARGVGHAPPCHSPERMEKQRIARRDRDVDRVVAAEVKARWNRTYNLSRYGLTQESFGRLLEDQDYACAMCSTPFEDGQKVCIDHDHACCPEGKRSCGKCVRGLLCHDCNTALGHIERKLGLARAYLDARKPRQVLVDGLAHPATLPTLPTLTMVTAWNWRCFAL